MLGECRALFSISGTVSRRLQRFNGLRATPLYHPPRLAARLRKGQAGGRTCSRSAGSKASSASISPSAPCSTCRGAVARDRRDGHTRRCAQNARRFARPHAAREISGRSVRRGPDSNSMRAPSAVVFPPLDEDYGYVTLEAFLSHKPVVTTDDAGGPNEFVTERRQRLGDRARSQGPGRRHRQVAMPTAAKARAWAMRVTIWPAASRGRASSTASRAPET